MLKFVRRRNRNSVEEDLSTNNTVVQAESFQLVVDSKTESYSRTEDDKSGVGEVSPIIKPVLDPKKSENINLCLGGNPTVSPSMDTKSSEGILNGGFSSHIGDFDEMTKSNPEDDSGIGLSLGNNTRSSTSVITGYSVLDDLNDAINEGEESLSRSQSNEGRDSVEYRKFDFQSGVSAEEFQEIKRSMRRNKGPSDGFKLRGGSVLSQESHDATAPTSTGRRASDVLEKRSDKKPPRSNSIPTQNGSIKEKLHKTDSSGSKSSERRGSNQSGGGSDLVIPPDGNLSSFSVDQMALFFRYFKISETVINNLKRHGVDGRKFSRTSDKDMETIVGIKHPILVYFRDRSKVNAGKSGKKTAFLL